MQTKTKDVKKDFQGMNTMIQSSRIPARACRDMQDCVVRKGVVRTRDGYTKEGVQLFDKVLSMYHCRGRVAGLTSILLVVDNVSHGVAAGDGAVNNPGPGTAGLIVIPSGYNFTGAHYTYNTTTEEWEYVGSGAIGQNDIPASEMPASLLPGDILQIFDESEGILSTRESGSQSTWTAAVAAMIADTPVFTTGSAGGNIFLGGFHGASDYRVTDRIECFWYDTSVYSSVISAKFSGKFLWTFEFDRLVNVELREATINGSEFTVGSVIKTWEMTKSSGTNQQFDVVIPADYINLDGDTAFCTTTTAYPDNYPPTLPDDDTYHEDAGFEGIGYTMAVLVVDGVKS